jgi:outer membrane lipoprotein SlyB
MTDEMLRLITVVLWQGFSLAFVITILARAALASSNTEKPNAIRMSMPLRAAIGAFAFVGLFGTASLAGTPAGLSEGAVVAALIGAICGTWLGYRFARQIA